MEPAVISSAGPADLIAYIWFSLGYRPQESLVLIGVHGPRQQLGVITRADLPAPHTRRAVLVAEVEALLQPLTVSGADAVMAVICGEGALSRPEPEVATVLRYRVRRLGLDLLDVLGQTPRGYRSVDCQDVGCCPAEGLPLAGVLGSRTAAVEVLSGRALAGSESELIADVVPESVPEPEPESVPEPEPGDRWAWWRWWLAQTGLDGARRPVQAHLAEHFWRELDDVLLRDAVVLHAMGAPAERCEVLLTRAAGWPQDDPQITKGLERPPNQARLRGARELLARSARAAEAGGGAPVLSALAMLAWSEGDGVRARLLADRALGDDPHYSLALLVQELLILGVAPPWFTPARPNRRAALDE